jgi:hypothetical protein
MALLNSVNEINESERARLAGIAHDYNNLLGVVAAFSSFAKKKVEAAAVDPSKVDQLQLAIRDLERVEHAAAEAVKLTRQLVALIVPEPPSDQT